MSPANSYYILLPELQLICSKIVQIALEPQPSILQLHARKQSIWLVSVLVHIHLEVSNEVFVRHVQYP